MVNVEPDVKCDVYNMYPCHHVNNIANHGLTKVNHAVMPSGMIITRLQPHMKFHAHAIYFRHLS